MLQKFLALIPEGWTYVMFPYISLAGTHGTRVVVSHPDYYRSYEFRVYPEYITVDYENHHRIDLKEIKDFFPDNQLRHCFNKQDCFFRLGEGLTGVAAEIVTAMWEKYRNQLDGHNNDVY